VAPLSSDVDTHHVERQWQPPYSCGFLPPTCPPGACGGGFRRCRCLARPPAPAAAARVGGGGVLPLARPRAPPRLLGSAPRHARRVFQFGRRRQRGGRGGTQLRHGEVPSVTPF